MMLGRGIGTGNSWHPATGLAKCLIISDLVALCWRLEVTDKYSIAEAWVT